MGSTNPLVLAILFVATRLATGESLTFGPGYDTIQWALDPQHGAWIVLLVLVLRCTATAVTLGGGGVGGLFIPLVVGGALTGRIIGGAVQSLDTTLFVVFGRNELQLATIKAARDSFITEVITPALTATEPGPERLMALCDGYLSYVERRVFPGGCFFVAASAEVGARSGRVHDEVATAQEQWRDLLDAEARSAHQRGELPEAQDPTQLAFELGVILAGTDIVSVLHNDNTVIARARAAVRSRLTA